MAKDPAVLFYTADFITGTLTMTDEQRGKYILLLCLQHQKGFLTEKDMLNICKTYDFDIYSKFYEHEGKYYNERMKEEADKRRRYSDSRRRNRLNASEEVDKNKNKICKTYDKHMENENINEDINKNVSVNSIEERQKIFKKEVESFSNKYSLNMLTAFYAYWSEPNQSGKKMRKEMQQTWETGRRLITWNNRDKK